MTVGTYWKVPFEWTSGGAPAADALPAGWSWSTGVEGTPPVELVADVLASSVGPEDVRAVEELGSWQAARRTLALAAGFSYLAERWHVLAVDGRPAGFVLPVVYDGCARDGLDEATIYHLGTAGAHRGRGIGRLLLRRATQVLVAHGVWRIYCDTPADNAAMIHLFERDGWTRLPPHERPITS